MDAGGRLVVPMDPVHTEIRLAGSWTLGVHQWQCNKMSAVFVPIVIGIAITLEIAMTNFFNRINRTVREQAGKTW